MVMNKNEIIAKAWKDPTFKRKLMNDPKSALKECGCTVPDNVNMKVIEDSENSYTFVIPHSPKNATELSEKELANVAGGVLWELD
jgi:hypothetical protein